MRRRLPVLVLSLVATAMLVAPATAASPSGRGTTTIRFTTPIYNDFVLGADVRCTGIHQYGPRWPGDATSGGREVYRGRSLRGPIANVEPGGTFVYEPGTWFSDYFAVEKGILVINTRPIRVKVSGNGLSYHAIAYYSD